MAPRPFVVFYSWQSDTAPAANRSLIKDALEGAAKDLGKDTEIDIEPRVEHDTAGVPGSPDIGTTIFRKIREADAIVADVTLGLTVDPRGHVPNPNVLFELGYALGTLGEDRIVQVANTAFGDLKDLPFDIRNRRTLTYESHPDATERAEARRKLRVAFVEALRHIAAHKKMPTLAYPASLEMTYTTLNRHPERHDHELHVRLRNDGNKTINQWHMEIELPRALQAPAISNGALVNERSTGDFLFYRMTHEGRRKSILPGDTMRMTLQYAMSRDTYALGDALMHRVITARAYVENELVGEVSRPVAEMQNF